MTGDDGGRPTTRRRALQLAGIASMTGIAGCGDIIESQVEAVGELPQLTIEDLRLVQVVEDTTVEGNPRGSPTSVPDPPLVAKYNVAPVFGLSGSKTDNLSGPLEIEVDVTNGPTETFEMARHDVSQIVSGDDPRPILHEAARDSDSAVHPPVFELADSHDHVTVRASTPEGLELDAATISKGSDYGIVAERAMKVGFIAIEDPDEGDNYGDSNGQCRDFNGSVEMAIEYLQRTYPGGLAAFRYDTPLTGDPNKAHNDYTDAWTTLQGCAIGLTAGPVFPNGGQFTNRSHKSDADARQSISSNFFDVVVLLVPEEYYDHHGKPNTGGLFPGSRTKAVSAIEEPGWWEEIHLGHVVAQEIGHYMKTNPYSDGPRHPLAQRDDDGQDATVSGTPVDRDHARDQDSDHDEDGTMDGPGVTSVGYDLTGGTFTTVDSPDLAAGTFDPGLAGTSIATLDSFMSYDFGDVWTDSRLYGETIATQFQRSNWTPPANGSTMHATGHVGEEGAVVFDSVTAFQGRPFDPPGEDHPVGITARDPDGEALATTTVADRLEMDVHVHETINHVEFAIPFPARAVAIEATRDGATTGFNAIVRPIRDAIDRVPDRGFRAEPAPTRERLDERLDLAATLMTDHAYAATADVLENDVRPDVAESISDEYEHGPRQPDADMLIELLDRMIERLRTLAAESG